MGSSALGAYVLSVSVSAHSHTNTHTQTNIFIICFRFDVRDFPIRALGNRNGCNRSDTPKTGERIREKNTRTHTHTQTNMHSQRSSAKALAPLTLMKAHRAELENQFVCESINTAPVCARFCANVCECECV